MINLCKLVAPENFDLFTRVPELNRIWEIPKLQQDARKAYEGWSRVKFKGETLGEIFTINKENEIIGILGWFQLENSLEIVRLWYYGVIPSRRGKGYGEIAVKIFLDYLAVHAPRECIFLSESVTLARNTAVKVIAHFKKMGFEEFDDPRYGENAGCGRVQSLRIRIPGR